MRVIRKALPRKPVSLEKAVQFNLMQLARLSPLEVAMEWYNVYTREKFRSPSRWDYPPEWFWEKKGLITHWLSELSLPGVPSLVPGAVSRTFETETGWHFRSKMETETRRIVDQEEHKVFDVAKVGLLERAREHRWAAATRDRVKLYLYERSIELPTGTLGMLVDTVNDAMGVRVRQKHPAVPENLRQLVFRRAGGKCEHCGVVTEFLEVDLIIPWSRGGTVVPENLQALCPKCNRQKGNRVYPHEDGLTVLAGGMVPKK